MGEEFIFNRSPRTIFWVASKYWLALNFISCCFLLLTDGLQKQIGMAEDQILEIVKAKDTALEEVTKLKEEIEENEKTHAEAMKAMQEAHREAQAKLEEDLTAQHQQAIQQCKSRTRALLMLLYLRNGPETSDFQNHSLRDRLFIMLE